MNLLITSVGRRSYLVEYFKKEMKNIGKVYVSNSTDITPAFSIADGSIVSPLIYSDDYIPFLLTYCRDKQINFIISLFDVDLYVLAKNKSKFEEIGVKIIVSDEKFVKICNDKWLNYSFLRENSIGVPNTYLSLDDAKNAIKDSILKYPVIIKPRCGMGSLSIYIANDDNELNVLYNKIKDEIKESYLKYEATNDFDNCVIIQEKIDGQEYGLDIINDLNGNYINTIVKKKIAMRSGETDCAEIIDNIEFINLGEKIGHLSKHIANLDVDIIYDGVKYYVLDMNARFGGGYPFSHMAGVNLPGAIIDWVNGKKVSKEKLMVKEYIKAHKDITIKKI